MPKIKYKKGSYKYICKPLEALSGHIVRLSYGGTVYGVPVTTNLAISWGDSSNTKPSEPALGSRLRFYKGGTVYAIRAETTYTDSHSNVAHIDSHNDSHTDWGNIGAWNNSGTFWQTSIYTGYHFNYSDTIRTEALSDNCHSDGTDPITGWANWPDECLASYSYPHQDGAGDGHINVVQYGYGSQYSGSIHLDWTNHSDVAHTNFYQDYPHSDSHSNWYDSLKESI